MDTYDKQACLVRGVCRSANHLSLGCLSVLSPTRHGTTVVLVPLRANIMLER